MLRGRDGVCVAHFAEDRSARSIHEHGLGTQSIAWLFCLSFTGPAIRSVSKLFEALFENTFDLKYLENIDLFLIMFSSNIQSRVMIRIRLRSDLKIYQLMKNINYLNI